jgi:hypothetical protein
MMSESENARSMIEAVIGNHKVAPAIALSTTAIGEAARRDVIQGWLAIVSMGIGIITSLLIAGWWAIRVEKAWRERKQPEKETT